MGGERGRLWVSIRTNHCATLRRLSGGVRRRSGSIEWRAWPGLLSTAGCLWPRSLKEEVKWRRRKQCGGGVFANSAGARGQGIGVPGGLAKCSARNVAGAVVGPSLHITDEQLFFLPSFLPLVAAGAEAPLPHRGFPASGPADPSNFTDIPARNSRTHTSLVQLLLTFSHCFWKGKQSLGFAAQTVVEDPCQSGEADRSGAHDHSSPIRQAADSQLGGRERSPLGPRPLLSLLGAPGCWGGWQHVRPLGPQGKVHKTQRGQTAACEVAQDESRLS